MDQSNSSGSLTLETTQFSGQVGGSLSQLGEDRRLLLLSTAGKQVLQGHLRLKPTFSLDHLGLDLCSEKSFNSLHYSLKEAVYSLTSHLQANPFLLPFLFLEIEVMTDQCSPGLSLFSQSVVLNSGQFCSPPSSQGYLATSGDILGCHKHMWDCYWH